MRSSGRIDQPLSVGIVTPTLSRSGGGIVPIVRAHVLHLREQQVDVVVYGLWDEHAETDSDDWGPVVPRSYRPWIRRFGYAPGLSRDLLRGAHDVVHQHGLWMYPSVAVARWRILQKKPVVISTQGMLEPWAVARSSLRKLLAAAWFERANLSNAACIHCSEAELSGVRAFGLRNPVAVLPNGVSPSIAEGPRPAWMVAGRRHLLFLGRLHPKKGIAELLRAWNILTSRRPDLAEGWLLTVGGWDDGGHAQRFRAQAASMGMDDSRVVFAGPLFGEDKAGALAHADMFVLPSYSEGLPMSVLEAWSYGLPVLMTRACNLQQALDSGAAIEVTTDPRALADELAHALSRDDLRQIGERGRAIAVAQFRWASIVSELREVYAWLAGRASRPACVRLA